MSFCPHKRVRSVILYLEPTELNQLKQMVITLQCKECGHPFEFPGIQERSGVILSADRRELRLSVGPARQGMIQ